jgi:hypothetical protein
MLREVNDINKAASPTKFAEYSMAGLSIVYSDLIGDLDNYNSELQNKLSEKDANDFVFNETNRINISNKAIKLLSKDNFINKYKELYQSMYSKIK